MTHNKTYIAGALCLILGMTSTLYAHDEPEAYGIDLDHKHHYRLDGTLERAEWYDEEAEWHDEETGKLSARFYYRADGTRERYEEYDPKTGKLSARYSYRADGTREQVDHYDIETGKVILREYYNLNGYFLRTEWPNK